MQEIFCIQEPTTIHGVEGKMMIYFDCHTHTELCKEFSESIDRLSAELSALKRAPVSKLKRYAKYFIVNKHKNDSGFDFIVDNNVVNEIRQKKGFFLVFTTDMTAKPEDSLYFYRGKDIAEKAFDQIKVDMGGNRVRTYSDSTTDGKIFVTFLALAIRSYMLVKLEHYLASNSVSLKTTLNKLEDIVIVFSNGSCRFSKALTKHQKEILASFNAVDDIASTLQFCIR
jgi:transposase